jgi:dihydrolipoamide dehydrogenase
MPASSFDCIVLGAGPGGYVCAIRAAQLGLRVALVEKRASQDKVRLGGTCLHVGCIPSKALLDSSEHVTNAKHHFAEHGIGVGTLSIDLGVMHQRKQKVVTSLADGLDFLMKKHGITVLRGTGSVRPGPAVQVAMADGSVVEHAARAVVLAMGSQPTALPSLPFDGNRIISSDQAIALPTIPKRLVVVGGGAIGLELGSVWSRLGSAVTVLEYLPQVCPFLDADIAKELSRVLTRQGLDIRVSTQVTGYQARGEAGVVLAKDAAGAPVEYAADQVLVAVGRRPATEGSGLREAGVALDERGRVVIDDGFRTSLAGVYAIGDLVRGPMLAHKAEEEGVAVAEILAGQVDTSDHHLIPSVVYTWPEVASIGITERDAAAAGTRVRVGRFPFRNLGRAKAAGEADGLVKVIADAQTDRVLGAAIVGPRASDLLAEITAVMAFGGSSEDIARTCHAHPTFSEAVREAALDTLGRVIQG